MKANIIQWYPGHIAKAERQLSKNIQKVDLVIEVRDARIPISSSHPYLRKWINGKKHLLIINRKDMISNDAYKIWNIWFKKKGYNPFWCNAKNGSGVTGIKEAAIELGRDINLRRESRGMRARPIRALILGFPNVGKSALINRLVNKKVVESSRKAGVTRSLRWVRIDNKLDLLDSPGVLPPRLEDQESALRLAFCDDIGQASYDVENVAISLLKTINLLNTKNNNGIKKDIFKNRYGIDLTDDFQDIHEWLAMTSSIHTSSDIKRMSQRILDDFRKTLLGTISLELP